MQIYPHNRSYTQDKTSWIIVNDQRTFFSDGALGGLHSLAIQFISAEGIGDKKTLVVSGFESASWGTQILGWLRPTCYAKAYPDSPSTRSDKRVEDLFSAGQAERPTTRLVIVLLDSVWFLKLLKKNKRKRQWLIKIKGNKKWI